MMRHGIFREDLYYRISTFRIISEPLREHPEDIPLLVKSYWERKGRKGKLSSEFLNYLKNYHWPGNVRELYALMNSIVDYFGDISPSAAHVDAIRKSRQEVLNHSRESLSDDPSQLLKIKSQSVLISVQNILRSVKIELRPVLNTKEEESQDELNLPELKAFIASKVSDLNTYCLEPTYFKSWELFKEVARYRYILDKTVKNWPSTPRKLIGIWSAELKKLDNNINQGIMDALWGKIDM